MHTPAVIVNYHITVVTYNWLTLWSTHSILKLKRRKYVILHFSICWLTLSNGTILQCEQTV